MREARERAKQRGEPQENLGPDFRVEPRLPVLQPTKFELVIKLVDSFILFEGEEALASLIESMRRGADFRNIPNLAYCSGNEFKRNPVKTTPTADLPTPDFRDFDLSRYLMPEVILPIYSSRSCFAKCSFCTIPFSAGGTYRTLRPERVFRTMQTLHERHGVFFFDIVDETIANEVKTRGSGAARPGLRPCG